MDPECASASVSILLGQRRSLHLVFLYAYLLGQIINTLTLMHHADGHD